MKNFIAAGLFAVAVASQASDFVKEYEQAHMQKYMAYLAKFGKSYSNSFEFEGRFKLWQKTDEFIHEWMDNHISN